MAAALALAYPAYRVAERLACALPERVVPWVTRIAGAVAAAVMRDRRRMVARHQERVRGRDLGAGERRRAVRATFRSYAAYWLDTFRMCRVDAGTLDRRVTADGLHHIDGALDAGNGVVLATPHLGSWDLAGAWLAHRGYPVVAVVERIEPPRLREWFQKVREGLGMKVVVRGADVWERLEEALGRNEVVVLVCDRDLSGRGVEVRFFGERTTLPAGPAKLARRCDAPLIPVAVYARDAWRHEGVVCPPIPVPSTDDERGDVAHASQALAETLEDLVRGAPEQWHLLQPNWPSDDRGR